MRVALLLVPLLAGCVGELLSPEQVTVRTVSCAFLDPQRDVQIVHHEIEAIPAYILEEVSRAWITNVASLTGRPLDGFDTAEGADPGHTGSWTRQSLAQWLRGQQVLTSDTVLLHVMWVEDLDGDLALHAFAPGFVAINVTAWRHGLAAGLEGVTVARALLFHGLGHVLGVVNLGVPLHDANGTLRERPAHHEPGGVLSDRWHHSSTFPRNATASGYSAAVVADWRHAQQEVCR